MRVPAPPSTAHVAIPYAPFGFACTKLGLAWLVEKPSGFPCPKLLALLTLFVSLSHCYFHWTFCHFPKDVPWLFDPTFKAVMNSTIAFQICGTPTVLLLLSRFFLFYFVCIMSLLLKTHSAAQHSTAIKSRISIIFITVFILLKI